MVTTAPSAFERAAQRAFDALFGHRFDEFKAPLAEGTDLEGHDLRSTCRNCLRLKAASMRGCSIPVFPHISHTRTGRCVRERAQSPIFRLPPSFRFTGCPVSYVNVTV
jgi:hypothetical protein